MYKPLPKELRLGFSDIHDIGLFAKEGIAQGTNLGMTHLKLGSQLIRTPLGGFINHHEDANCVKAELRFTNEDDPELKNQEHRLISNILNEQYQSMLELINIG